MTPTPLAPMQGRGGPVQRGLGGRRPSCGPLGRQKAPECHLAGITEKKPFGVERTFILFEDSATGDAVSRLRPQTGH